MRPNSLRKAFMPGTKDPNGWENGYVEPQRTYQNVGSQTPIAHDRDGHPVEVEGKGMMKIPGYEWHDKSPEFHKLAKRVAAKYASSARKSDVEYVKYDDHGDWTQWSPRKIRQVLKEVEEARHALRGAQVVRPQEGYDLVEETAPENWRSMSEYEKVQHLNTPIYEVKGVRLSDPFNLINGYRKFLMMWLHSQGLPPVYPVKWASNGDGYTAKAGRKTVRIKTVRDLYLLNDLLEIDSREHQEIEDGLDMLEEKLTEQLKKRVSKLWGSRTSSKHEVRDLPLPGVISDSGWKVRSRGSAYTEWQRTLEVSPERGISPEDYAEMMVSKGDYPGWTGVTFAKGYSKGNKYVFVSTWDSGD